MQAASKACSKCRRVLPLDQFGFRGRHTKRRKSHCRDCCRETQRNWTLNNPERRLEHGRKWRELNRGVVRERRWLDQGIDLTWSEYEWWQRVLGARCQGCGKECRPGSLVPDHEHGIGSVRPRGFLCTQCNIALGLARDSADVLVSLARYRRTHDAELPHPPLDQA